MNYCDIIHKEGRHGVGLIRSLVSIANTLGFAKFLPKTSETPMSGSNKLNAQSCKLFLHLSLKPNHFVIFLNVKNRQFS